MNDISAGKLDRIASLTGGDADASVTIRTSAGPVRLTLTNEFEALKDQWLALQQRAACSYSQSYHWAEGWQRIVSVPTGGQTALVHGVSATGETLFILPFELSRLSGQRVIRFIGQDHANYNCGLFRPDFAIVMRRSDMDGMLCAAADLMGGADAALFAHQPFDLGGVANPLSLMPHRPSANRAHGLRLGRDFEAIYTAQVSKKRRSAFARCERRLAAMGPVEFAEARDAREAAALLDICFAQKRERFRAKGIVDSFADARYRDFYKQMTALDGMSSGPLLVSSLKVGGEVVATSARVVFGKRHYDVLSSVTSGPMQAESPGQLLTRSHIEDACAKGYEYEDFGTGAGPHKDIWCDTMVALFDSNLPLSPKGHALCLVNALKSRGKRWIKTSPALWAAYQAARRRLRGSR